MWQNRGGKIRNGYWSATDADLSNLIGFLHKRLSYLWLRIANPIHRLIEKISVTAGVRIAPRNETRAILVMAV